MDPTSVSNNSPVPLTSHIGSVPDLDSDDDFAPPAGIDLGRERSGLPQEVWERVDRAVHRQSKRARLCAKFLPQHRVPPHTLSVPADIVLGSLNGSPLNLSPLSQSPVNTPIVPAVLNTAPGPTIPIFDLSIQFALTHSQMEEEKKMAASGDAQTNDASSSYKTYRHSTLVNLAVRATVPLCYA
jgi:hypothetical protein